jgi:transposase
LVADKADDEKIFWVADGRPTHRAKSVQREIESHNGEVELFFLAGYSPELNPDEQVWNYVKSQIGRGIIETQDDLRS